VQPPFWTAGDSSAIAGWGAQIRALCAPPCGECRCAGGVSYDLFRDPDGNLVNFFTPVTPAAIEKFAR
jgi:hypothetical protein